MARILFLDALAHEKLMGTLQPKYHERIRDTILQTYFFSNMKVIEQFLKPVFCYWGGYLQPYSLDVIHHPSFRPQSYQTTGPIYVFTCLA